MKNLRKLREQKEISQKELAEYLGVSQNAVSSYELGKREPSIDTLVKLADLYEVSVDYLLGHVPLGEDPEDQEGLLLIMKICSICASYLLEHPLSDGGPKDQEGQKDMAEKEKGEGNE